MKIQPKDIDPQFAQVIHEEAVTGWLLCFCLLTPVFLALLLTFHKVDMTNPKTGWITKEQSVALLLWFGLSLIGLILGGICYATIGQNIEIQMSERRGSALTKEHVEKGLERLKTKQSLTEADEWYGKCLITLIETQSSGEDEQTFRDMLHNMNDLLVHYRAVGKIEQANEENMMVHPVAIIRDEIAANKDSATKASKSEVRQGLEDVGKLHEKRLRRAEGFEESRDLSRVHQSQIEAILKDTDAAAREYAQHHGVSIVANQLTQNKELMNRVDQFIEAHKQATEEVQRLTADQQQVHPLEPNRPISLSFGGSSTIATNAIPTTLELTQSVTSSMEEDS